MLGVYLFEGYGDHGFLTRDSALHGSLQDAAGPPHRIVSIASWDGLIRLVRERPVTSVALDESALALERTPEEALADLDSRFPNLGLMVLSHRQTDPLRLFRLGRAGIPNLVLLGVEELSRAVPRGLQRASERGATARVTRAMVPYLPRREMEALRMAMEGIHNRWSADRFASIVGLSRAFLSERLKACGSRPPVTLVWVRLFCRVLARGRVEPARAVSRQLEY